MDQRGLGNDERPLADRRALDSRGGRLDDRDGSHSCQGQDGFLRVPANRSATRCIYYVAHPKARPGTDFKLVRVEGQSAVFENLAHDFPKRLIYRKNADGSLTTRVEWDGTEKEKPEEFRWRSMK